MTMIKKLALSIGAAAAAMAMSLSAQAATISNANGTFGFTGFDWDANGTAFTTGFAGVGSVFTLQYFSWATSVKNGPDNLALAGLDSIADGIALAPFGGPAYEYTVYANLTEQVVSCVSATECTFAVVSGTYEIRYDTQANANVKTAKGTGFTDGTLIIAGSFDAQPGGSFTVTGSGGSGFTTLLGNVTYTNLDFINPALTDTVVGTTLQLGDKTTNLWTSPGGFNGVAFTGTADQIVFQADANQSFTGAVPEPGSLALVSLALLGVGAVARRRKS